MNPSRTISPFLATFFLVLLTALLANRLSCLPYSYILDTPDMRSVTQRSASQLISIPFASRFQTTTYSNSNLFKNYSTMSSNDPNLQTSTSATADTVDSDSFHPDSEPADSALPLPAPGEGTSDAQTIDLGGEGGGRIKLDALGPMVVNKDGTLSRIANWQKMTEIEKKNTLRILGKRNQLRLGTLKGETK
ncbi:hypothetical protein IWX92DRAFT_375105 [Phyllosticta citricarpa]